MSAYNPDTLRAGVTRLALELIAGGTLYPCAGQFFLENRDGITLAEADTLEELIAGLGAS